MMKTFITLALTLVLTASLLVGCGCTNQNMDNTSAPTVLPTNEEIWNSTESTTRSTTEGSMTMETNNGGTNGGGTNGGTNGSTTTESTEETRGVNETEVQNHVNAHTEMMDKIREKNNATTPSEGNGGNNASRMMPGSR